MTSPLMPFAGTLRACRKSLVLAALLLVSTLTSTLAGCSPRESPMPGASEGKIGEARQVHFKTTDGWTIVGDLYTPSGAPKGAVILLHQRNGSARDWEPLCLALQKAGFTALAIDQRGAGRSTQGPGPTGG